MDLMIHILNIRQNKQKFPHHLKGADMCCLIAVHKTHKQVSVHGQSSEIKLEDFCK